ncbi:MAG: glutamate--tRNA ligase [Clostridia bacterium]|nr:glutamate--tRNA ligase [Clostridia bacterium]
MERKDLADLIFPNAKDTSYYEEKYPERDLDEGAIVTRFAPSPTGFVHIGALEQCIIETALTKQTNGKLLLRIEDTDQKRTIENGIQGIVESLKDFDIHFDEGMRSETESYGEYGPYIQSSRKEIYEAYAKYLIEIGRAYPCFASEEELDEMRKKQEEQKLKIGYYGNWAKYRTLPIEEAAKRIKNGERYVIRFKSMGNEEKRFKFKDMVKGKVNFVENDLDVVIIKGDGLPTYHFAHAVDDHLMRVTHVIRSNEWLPSVPLHLELFNTLGFEPPKYCHYSPMLKEEDGRKRKISKRKDPEAAVSYYHKAGIPVEAVREYLMGVANSNFEMWRSQNPDKDIYEFPFELSRMSLTGALFDLNKLNDISKNVISRFPTEKIYQYAYEWAERYDDSLKELLEDKDFSYRVLNIERNPEIKKRRKDIGKWSDLKNEIEYMYDKRFLNKKVEYPYQVISDKEDIEQIIKLYIQKYYNEEDDKTTWFNKIKELAGELGYAKEVKEFKANPKAYKAHVGDVSTVLRVALTGRTNTPDMYEIMKVLGKESMAKRYAKAIVENNLDEKHEEKKNDDFGR